MPPLLHSLDCELQIIVRKLKGKLGKTIQVIFFDSISLVSVKDIDAALSSVSFGLPDSPVVVSEQALMGW